MMLAGYAMNTSMAGLIVSIMLAFTATAEDNAADVRELSTIKIVVTLAKDGSVVVDGKNITDEELAKQLSAKAKDGTLEITLFAAGSLVYTRVVTVANICRKVAPEHVSLKVTPDEKQAEKP
jgi:biopolymer transport protein ExbD